MKKIEPVVYKETANIALWTLILSAIMQAVFLVIGKWDYTVLLGAISQYPAKLGVQISVTTVPETGEFGLKIEQFTENTYDAARKLKVGDIITHLNGVKFNSSSELSMLLDKCSPGETVSVTYYRDGQYQEIYVRLGR